MFDDDADIDDQDSSPDERPGDPVGGGPGAADPETHLREVTHYLAASLVDDPGAVEVMSRSRDRAVQLSLRVADGELGKIIGRQGRTARAIRTAVQIAGARHDVRVTLDIEG